MDRQVLLEVLTDGRISCYVSKTAEYNPYKKSDTYDWYFEKEYGEYKFTDSYRGFNPYAGVESVICAKNGEAIWTCDYVGYVLNDCPVDAGEIYSFLKEARGAHLKECGGRLFTGYIYEKDHMKYVLSFEIKDRGILEKADIYYNGRMVAQHIASGIEKRKK